MHAGVETYIASTVPALAAAGHEIAFFSEGDEPDDRPPILLPAGVPAWCAERDGAERAVRELERWAPDVIFAHSLLRTEVHERVFDLAPTVYFAHVLAGACITGAKVVHRPTIAPCSRRFGPACLAHYFPSRCGGLSPISMVREYGRQSRRQRLVRRARTLLKGGQCLVDAAGRLAAETGMPIHVVFAGEGPSRSEWEARAASFAAGVASLTFEFLGWVSPEEKDRGTPAAAFAVGGIPEWLDDGMNGYLAGAEPPTGRELARAIQRCIADRETYRALSRGAMAAARRYSADEHVTRLNEIFERAAHLGAEG
jgi:hypothetical protein